MGNTTFNGPVRSENGFAQISIDSSTGVETTLLRQTSVTATSAAVPVTAAGNTDTLIGVQPAGTFIKDLILYNSANFVTAGAGGDDLDISLGTASGGAQIMAATALLDDAGGAVTWTASTPLYLIENARGHAVNKFSHVNGGPVTTEAIAFASAGIIYSAAERSIYARLTPLAHNLASGGGTVKFVATFQYI